MARETKMKTNRLSLQLMLEAILGSKNVYFQPPPSLHMAYPAIVYSRSNIENRHADNNVYMQSYCYKITVISKDPDIDVVDKLSLIPMCEFDRHFTSDNLNHNVFTLYYQGGHKV